MNRIYEIQIPPVSKQKKKKELGGVKVEHDTNKFDPEERKKQEEMKLDKIDTGNDSVDSATKREQEKMMQDYKY